MAKKQTPPAGSLIVDTKYSRSARVLVSVVDMDHPDSEWKCDGHRWAALCIEHDFAWATKTRRESHQISAHPERWCPACRRKG